MNDRTTIVAVALAALLVGSIVGASGAGVFSSGPSDRAPGGGLVGATADPSVDTFDSDEEFVAYFERSDRTVNEFGAAQGRAVATDGGAVEEQAAPTGGPGADADDGGSGEFVAGSEGASSGPDRHSQTNVQVESIDEPDVLKNDGEAAYYAGYRFHTRSSATDVVDLSDPAKPEVVASIPGGGELVLVEDRDLLVVLDHDRVYGYDVSEPGDPDQLWSERLDAQLQTARLYDGELYLVMVDRPGIDPCPVVPMDDVVIPCTDVYRPGAQADADAVYTTARLDVETGDVEDSVSVVGSTRQSATYVSENAIYLSYTRTTSQYDLMSSYLLGPGAEHLDDRTVERLEALEGYDISERAKQVEFVYLLEQWRASLDDEERRETERALEEGFTEYEAEHQRELTRTGIVRVDIGDDLEVTATGEVPGVPLNQFSMDEHEDHLRIATTISGFQVDSENDVYVLDSNLDVTGSVQGLGVDERIYSVRFEGDEGVVVTFREIDPFYTLDLSDPTDPRVEGELKLPGFSSYLHPLEEDLVLGIGQEDRRVKATTFDVSDRKNPTEVDSVILEDEYFSEIGNNHRAFLQDERHGVFFLPGNQHSYVFSYEDGDLEEVARVNVGGPGVRAMYVDDYLYVFGPGELVVLDETDWTEVDHLRF